jgi:ribosomal protein S18 acetylase RimI-like enzyme
VRIEEVGPEHVEAVAALCECEGWPSWADRDRVRGAVGAAGATSLVAVEGERVVGAAHVISDGAISTYLGMLLVDSSQRGRGIGRALVRELFARGGFRRMDLLAVDEAAGFYERFDHRRFPGFRVYTEGA